MAFRIVEAVDGKDNVTAHRTEHVFEPKSLILALELLALLHFVDRDDVPTSSREACAFY